HALRIWSAASSTGEEPYSIAITLLEAQNRIPALRRWDLRVFASDVDTHVLETARRGVYPGDELDGVDSAMRKSYFLRGCEEMAGTVKVKNQLAALVDFRRITLMDSSWPIE